MNQVNYQRELEKIIDKIVKEGAPGDAPTLFLHSCCAPCSSYVLEYLAPFFRITVFYYNPNISEDSEYRKRVEEQKRLIGLYNEAGKGHTISIVEGDYDPERFYEAVKGFEHLGERSARCVKCFELRLQETAGRAREGGYDYFGTTLTISPLKDANILNAIGMKLSGDNSVKWLPSDFKKKNGYKRSVELSEEYGLYRQDFCGCSFSRDERSRVET